MKKVLTNRLAPLALGQLGSAHTVRSYIVYQLTGAIIDCSELTWAGRTVHIPFSIRPYHIDHSVLIRLVYMYIVTTD